MENILSDQLYANMEYFHRELQVETNFDIIFRMLNVGERNACMFFIDGFIKDDIMEKLMDFFHSITPEDLPEGSEEVTKNCIPYVEVDMLDDLAQIK